MWVNVGRMFALLLLAACPMLNGIARGQDAAPSTTMWQCSETSYCKVGKIASDLQPHISDLFDTPEKAEADLNEKVRKYREDHPCSIGAYDTFGRTCIEIVPLANLPQTVPRCQSMTPTCSCDVSCPQTAKWRVTVKCSVISRNGQPLPFDYVEETCFGRTKLEAKRAAETKVNCDLFLANACCVCRTVTVARMKYAPCQCK